MKASYFENYLSSTPTKTVNIFDWLSMPATGEQVELINRIRAGENDLKKYLPCITPSGTFNPKRAVNNLVNHSGFLFVDIDGKDNLNLKDLDFAKVELSKIKEVAYCAKSVSNNGLHLLFKLGYPEKHLKHFEYLEKYFLNKGIKIDPACKDVSRLKGLTLDPTAYFNSKADNLYRFAEDKPKTAFKTAYVANENETVWDAFNKTCNVPEMLESYGFIYVHTKGTRMRYCRPGKANGVSIDFCTERRIIYFFTSSTPVDTGGKQPFSVFAAFQFNGDKSEAARYLLKEKV